jgi:hypothetical protein
MPPAASVGCGPGEGTTEEAESERVSVEAGSAAGASFVAGGRFADGASGGTTEADVACGS